MASTWGTSWGTAWADSWGATTPAATPAIGGGDTHRNLRGYAPKPKPARKEREQYQPPLTPSRPGWEVHLPVVDDDLALVWDG